MHDGKSSTLRALASRLDTLGLEDLGRSLLDRAVLVSGASAAVLGTVDGAAETIRVSAVIGFHDTEVREGQRYPVDGDTMLGAAVIDRRPVVASPNDLATRFPALQVFDRPAVAWAALPALIEEVPVAVIGLRFDEPLSRQVEGVVGQLEYALNTRVVVEQAKGVLAGRHGVGVDAAYERLRHHARSRSLPIQTVAEEVLAGRVDPFRTSDR